MRNIQQWRAKMMPKELRDDIKRAVVRRDGLVCWLCKEPIASFAEATMDHVKKASRGGEFSEQNLRPAHKKCNSERADKNGELLAELENERGANERLRNALTAGVEQRIKRCFETDCPTFAGWREAVDGGGRDRFWCEEHVCIPQKAISKGASRYQPQRIQYAGWLKGALEALGYEITDPRTTSDSTREDP